MNLDFYIRYKGTPGKSKSFRSQSFYLTKNGMLIEDEKYIKNQKKL